MFYFKGFYIENSMNLDAVVTIYMLLLHIWIYKSVRTNNVKTNLKYTITQQQNTFYDNDASCNWCRGGEVATA